MVAKNPQQQVEIYTCMFRVIEFALKYKASNNHVCLIAAFIATILVNEITLATVVLMIDINEIK